MKKTLLRAFLLALLACLLVLPMTFMVGAADGDTVDGYYFVDRFKTNWAGSKITTGAAWGYKWVRSDGANNGSILIPNSVTTGNQVVLSDDGVLSFWNTSAKCKINIFELAMNKVEAGPAMMKFDLKFDPESFSGLEIEYASNTLAKLLLKVKNDGSVTVDPTNQTVIDTLQEGWNTIYIYLLPKYNAADNPNTPTVDETTVRIGTAAFLAIENEVNQVPDTRGVTLENLRAQSDVYYEYDYSVPWTSLESGYADLVNISTSLWIKADDYANKGYSIANMEYFNLEKGPLYSVNYTGYPDLTSYVGETDSTNILKVPSVEGVSYWKGTDAGGKVGFYAAGGTVKVLSNMQMVPATGIDLLTVELGAAVSGVDVNNISSYTFVEIEAALASLQTTMTNFTQGGGATSNEYYTQALQVSSVLTGAKAQRKQASDALIEYAEIFSDTDEDLESRMEAYEEALALDGAYDATYVDGSGYQCQLAIYALNEFSATVEAMDGAWERYQEGLDELEEADSSTDYAPIIDKLLNAIYQIRRSGFPTFANFNSPEDDESVAAILSAYRNQYMNGMKSRFDSLDGIAAKFEFLCDWTEDYNNYEAILKIRNDVTVPAALTQAIDDYNALVEETINSISSCTYVEISAALESLNAVMNSFTQAGGATNNEYYMQAVRVAAAMNSAKSAKKQASDALIEYAAIFGNTNKDLEDRMEAYEEALGLDGSYDGTYVDGRGYSCQRAIDALDDFTASVVATDGAWEDYQHAIEDLKAANATTDIYTIYEQLQLDLRLLQTGFSFTPKGEEETLVNICKQAYEKLSAAVADFAITNAATIAALENLMNDSRAQNSTSEIAKEARALLDEVSEIESEQVNAEMAELLGGWEDDLSIEELYALLYDAIALKLSSEKYLSEDNLTLLEAYIEEYNALVRVHNQDIEDAIYVACTVAGRAESFEIEVAPPPAQYAEKKEEEEQV